MKRKMIAPVCRDTPARLPAFLLLGTMAVLTGCADTSIFTRKIHQTPDYPVASAENPITQILAVWQVAEGTGIDGKYSRGAAGQVFFITRENSAPARVKGKVRVYLFDDQGTPEEQAKPIHQFDFEPAAWDTHLTHHTLGPAYRLFIPYVRGGTHQARCSLRVRFTQEDGQHHYSEMVSLTFPGTRSSDSVNSLTSPAKSATASPETTAKAPEVTPIQARGQSPDDDAADSDAADSEAEVAWWEEPAEDVKEFDELDPATQQILLETQGNRENPMNDSELMEEVAASSRPVASSPKWYRMLLEDVPLEVPMATDSITTAENELEAFEFEEPVSRESLATDVVKNDVVPALSETGKRPRHPLEDVGSPLDHPLAKLALEEGGDPHPIDSLREEILVGRQNGPRIRPDHHPLRDFDTPAPQMEIIQTSAEGNPAVIAPVPAPRAPEVVPLAEPIQKGRTKLETFSIPLPGPRRLR